MNKSDLSLHRGALCWLVLVWTVGGLGGHALAQKKARPTIQQQKEASSQFSICREIAKEGDASGCWRVWLRKYKDIGSEAEVAYAEEHSVQVPEKLPENPETTKPKEPVKENPEKVGKEEQPNPEKKTPAEGQHGEDKPKDSDKDTQKDNSVPEAALLAQGNVLDFCSLKSSENSSKFVKKRVVLMAISSSERIEEDSSARSLHGANIAREVFSSRFPLGRFYNVVSSIPGDVNWTSGKTSIQVEDVVKHLENDSSKVTAEERKFISYSLKCTDFLAVPNTTAGSVG